MDKYTFGETVRLADDFESLLTSKGIEVAPGGILEDLLLSTAEVEYLYKKLISADPTRDTRELFQKMIGIADILKKVIAFQGHQDFDQVLEHLKLLNASNPIQTKQANYTDRDSNKLFELYVSSLVMRIGKQVVVDDPNESKGDNPDVLATIDGVRWGFACKVPYSRKAKSILKNIVRGIEQIDASEATKGVVVMGARNILERQSFWPEVGSSQVGDRGPLYGAFATKDVPSGMLEDEARSLHSALAEEIGSIGLVRTFRSHKTVSGLLLHAMVASAIEENGTPVPMSISRIMVIQVEGLNPDEVRVASMLNDAAQWCPRHV